MKNSILPTLLLIILSAIAGSAQVNPSISAANPGAKAPVTRLDTKPDTTAATRVRVLGYTVKRPATGTADNQTLQAHAKVNFKNRARLESLRSGADETIETSAPKVVKNSGSSTTSKKDPTTVAAMVKTPVANPASNTKYLPVVSATASQIYRVGVGDVLDIKLNENVGPASTLFTVVGGGMLEYPLVGVSLPVAGLTTTEIAALLKQNIKLFENPTVAVSVRDYASHNVTISGLVAAPGTKALRREAVPLYALLAESVVLSDASRATINRAGNSITINLNDPIESGMLILPGDVIKVAGSTTDVAEFFFVAGEVKVPGQKPYHSGLTLTQAILAGGGATHTAGERVRVSRQRADGRVVSEEYDLKKIQEGKAIDPLLQRDDRIDVEGVN